MNRHLDAETLHSAIESGDELALLDVREEAAFSRGHLLFAVCLPLSQLELRLAALVPRATTRIVVCDEDGQLAERALTRLADLGYINACVLEGGIAAWAAAGHEVFSGVNVPSKAFGEFVEHACDTPSIAAAELNQRLDAGDDVVVLDSRPLDEYRLMNIPTGICTPGAELVYRVAEMAPSPETLVVVNCAGRTRSIIGAQSLINAGIPNPVVALRNGTMGWHLAGYSVERDNPGGIPPVGREAVDVARARAAVVADRFGVRFITRTGLVDLEADRERNVFLLDVRTPDEYAAGHPPGARSAPGGQLVQATDTYVGVRGATLVLCDDTSVRAIMTASWLIQMGWQSVFVLDGGLDGMRLETGPEHPEILGLEGLEVDMVSAPELSRLLSAGRTRVIDLSPSRDFRVGHIAGARHAVRSRLREVLATSDDEARLVLTSGDGVLARLGARDLRIEHETEASALMGGNRAWRDAGLPLASGEEGLEPDPDDVWLKPYEDTRDIEQAMRDYLSWEVDLVHQIERDGTARFRRFD